MPYHATGKATISKNMVSLKRLDISLSLLKPEYVVTFTLLVLLFL